MRQYKFRFWYKKEKRWLDNVRIDNHGDIYPIDINGEEDSTIDCLQVKKSQFTGLKDRHGKEIYEGDIIGRRGMKNTFVEYEGCRWVLRYDEPKIEWRQDLHNQTSLHLEVIGNIYENSDLLP